MANTESPFVWGDAGAQMTPERIAAQRKIAEAMMARGMDYSPIRSPWQGAARVSEALLGGLDAGRADAAERSNIAADRAMIASLLNGGGAGAPTAPISAPASAPSPDVAPATTTAGLPRGLRNNNPLNIEAGDFTQSQPGFAGSDGRFAKFETPEAGVSAANKLLDTYQNKYGLNTPAGIVGRWAPASDGNNVNAYAGAVAAKLGIGPNDPISPEMRPQLIAAMGQHENGRPIGNVAPQAAPVQVAQAAPSSTVSGLQGVNPALLQAMASPYASEGTKKIAAIILQSQLGDKATYQTTPDGDILQMDPHGRLPPKVVYKAAVKPVAMQEGGWLAHPFTGQIIAGSPGSKPTNDQKNYEGYAQAEKAAGRTPADFGAWLETMKKAGAQGVYMQGEEAFNKTYGEGQAKSALSTIETGDKASTILQRNQVLRSLNNAISTGKITPATATIGAWAKSMGFDPATLGINQSLPVNAETFNALSNESMMSKLGPGGFPSQNFSDTDRKFLEKTVTNLADQPGANELKLAISDRISQLQMEKADKWQEISTSVPRAQRAEAYDKFERDWRKDMKTRNVFGDIIQKIGGATGNKTSTGVTWSIQP
jgi:hypothetical protein